MAKKKITIVKVKKKKWYPIIATKSFNETVLGESYITEAAKLKDKFVTINLSKVTNNYRDQNINLTFKVTNVKDNKGITSLVSYNILPSFIKRFVRRDKSKIADSFILKDKEGRKIRMKPLVVTNTLATRAQKTLIRLAVRDFTKKYFEKLTFDTFIDSLMKKEFQKKLKFVLKKTMPIRYAEIRKASYDNLKFVSLHKQDMVDEDIVEEIKKADAEVEAPKVEEVKVEKAEEVKAEVKVEAKPEVVETPKEEPKAEVKVEPAKEEAPIVEEVATEEVKKE
jgi:ribosomal protein S3AE